MQHTEEEIQAKCRDEDLINLRTSPPASNFKHKKYWLSKFEANSSCVEPNVSLLGHKPEKVNKVATAAVQPPLPPYPPPPDTPPMITNLKQEIEDDEAPPPPPPQSEEASAEQATNYCNGPPPPQISWLQRDTNTTSQKREWSQIDEGIQAVSSPTRDRDSGEPLAKKCKNCGTMDLSERLLDAQIEQARRRSQERIQKITEINMKNQLLEAWWHLFQSRTHQAMPQNLRRKRH